MGVDRRAILAALADVQPEMLVLCDEQGAVLEVNETLERRFGYSRAELVGTSIFDHIHPDDVEYMVLSLSARLHDVGPGLPVEIRVRASDGSIVLCEAVGEDLRHVEGVGAVVGSLRDISRRPALADSPVRLRAMVNSSSEITLLVDADGLIQYSSMALSRLLGQDADAVVGRPALDLFHPDDVAASEQVLAELRDPAERVRSWRARLVHADGSVRVFDLQADDQLDDPVVAGMIVSARDATALQDAELRFDDLFEDAPIGMALLGPEGTVLRANDALAELLHLPVGSLDGHPFAEVAGVSAAGAVVGLLDTRRRGGRARSEVEVARADGSVAWVSIVVSAVRDLSGAGGTALAQIEDVTDRQAREQQLRSQNEALAMQAHHDPVTGLPNRAGFDEVLRRSLARSARDRGGIALMFCDLDRFKEVNDRQGHAEGDQLLAVVADRLRGAVRTQDVVARHGGDEFVVICEDLTDHGVLRQLAERISRNVATPVALPGGTATVGISIGVACCGDGDVDAEHLLAVADGAMYQAKSGPGDTPVLLDVSDVPGTAET